ncbi:MAG: hypothetical protein ACRDZ2_07595 [Ilumatobacteraceae bacterium]
MRTVAEKMGVRAGSRAHLIDAPSETQAALELPSVDLSHRLQGRFDYLHLFVRRIEDLDRRFPRLRDHLRDGGMLWVSWPKGRRLGTDLTLRDVIRIGYSHGLVESTTLAVDSTWSAIKFTRPRTDRTYHNSYGQLPGTR